MIQEEFKFHNDYRTLKQAAAEIGVQYDALRRWCWFNKVPAVRIGRSLVVRMSDLSGYSPRLSRDELVAR